MGGKFQGRVIFPASVEGEAVVSRLGFNTLACFYGTILNRAERAICGDLNNPELFGKDLTGKILCVPKSIGSTSAGATWDYIAAVGLAPKAVLFSEKIDSLSAAGLVISEVWAGLRICTIDQLGSEFLNFVKTGNRLVVREDGRVVVISSGRR